MISCTVVFKVADNVANVESTLKIRRQYVLLSLSSLEGVVASSASPSLSISSFMRFTAQESGASQAAVPSSSGPGIEISSPRFGGCFGTSPTGGVIGGCCEAGFTMPSMSSRFLSRKKTASLPAVLAMVSLGSRPVFSLAGGRLSFRKVGRRW